MELLYYIASILLLPMIIYSFIISRRVKSIYNEYSSVYSSSGLMAFQVVRKILDNSGLNDVGIERINGNLTDHYDPRDNTIYLSENVYASSSVAAIGVAAHEAGHAIQFSENYVPVKLRTRLVPAVNLTSKFSLPLILIGLIFSVSIPYFVYFAYMGIAFYALTTIFTFVTLPVEYNASSRAKKILAEENVLSQNEVSMAGEVLNAAAKTYLVSFLISLLFLIRLLAIFARRR